jgi:uncharacterized membrane protein (UPF0127 family)
MAGKWKLLNRATGAVVAETLEVADSFLTRLRGLQFRSALPPGHALLLVPCSSVHTHWMRFPIDVVMVSNEAEVVEIHENVRPWKMLGGAKKTHAVIEFPAKTAGVAQGDRFRIEAVDHSQPPPPESLRFLCA